MKNKATGKVHVTIEYAQYDGSNLEDIEQIAGGNVRMMPIEWPYGRNTIGKSTIHILTWAGWAPLLERDYIILIDDVLDVWSSNRFEHLISAKTSRNKHCL